jgi:hypothetical protein
MCAGRVYALPMRSVFAVMVPAVAQLDVYLVDEHWSVKLDRCADAVFRLTPGPPKPIVVH